MSRFLQKTQKVAPLSPAADEGVRHKRKNMGYKYRKDARLEVKFNSKLIEGLPGNISLNIGVIYLRFFNSEENNNYFYCSISIPSVPDEEGYITELPISENTKLKYEQNLQSEERCVKKEYDHEEDSYVNTFEYRSEIEEMDPDFENYQYLVPRNGIDLSEISNKVSLKYESKVECGQFILLLNIKVMDTSYLGYALIEDEFYERVA